MRPDQSSTRCGIRFEDNEIKIYVDHQGCGLCSLHTDNRLGEILTGLTEARSPTDYKVYLVFPTYRSCCLTGNVFITDAATGTPVRTRLIPAENEICSVGTLAQAVPSLHSVAALTYLIF